MADFDGVILDMESGELFSGGRDGDIAFDERGSYSTQGFNAQRERNDV